MIVEFGIKLVALGGSEVEPPQWVVSYDPDGGDLDLLYPTGELSSSPEAKLAMRFPTKAEAMAVWRQQSTRTPYRPDGRPNRPLTAFTVSIEAVPTEEEE